MANHRRWYNGHIHQLGRHRVVEILADGEPSALAVEHLLDPGDVVGVEILADGEPSALAYSGKVPTFLQYG